MNSEEKTYLYKIIDTILQVAQGDYQIQIPLHHTNDDLDALAMGINLMIDDIRVGVESIEEGRDDLKNIMASIIDILIVVNSDLTIRSINAVGLEELGYTLEEIDNQDLSMLFENSPVFSEEEYQMIINCGSGKNLERNIRLKNGEIRPVLCSVSVMHDKEKNISAFICTVRDINEIKIAEQKLKEHAIELEKINKELNQFAYIASHDLKAPLRAISNLSQWIEEDLGDDLPEDVKSHTALLRSRVVRMQALIDGILSYSRINRTEKKCEAIDTNQLIEDIHHMIEVPASIKIVKSSDFPLINADRIQLEQVFTNLISNAIKYHDKTTGTITLTHKKNDETHEFSVADDGPGIPSEYHEKIFVIFQTLEARDKIESTGVGLAIVKKIVEENGGIIKVESTPGEGTTFIFTWPNKYSCV